MAIMLYGNGVADIRGSINGTTFSRNANGAYTRNRTAPVNPQSPLQQAVRIALGDSSRAWRELTDAQRQAWIDAATTVMGQYTNRLGQTLQYTGQQLYMAVQQRRNAWLHGGGTITGNGSVEPPPIVPAPPAIEFGTSTATTSAEGALATFALAITSAAGTNQLMVYASPPVSAGIMRPSSTHYTLLESIEDVSTGTPPSLLAAYNAAYGAVVYPGDAIWLRLVRLSTTSWRIAAPYYQKVVATLAA